jgi:hypothetical protein
VILCAAPHDLLCGEARSTPNMYHCGVLWRGNGSPTSAHASLVSGMMVGLVGLV